MVVLWAVHPLLAVEHSAVPAAVEAVADAKVAVADAKVAVAAVAVGDAVVLEVLAEDAAGTCQVGRTAGIQAGNLQIIIISRKKRNRSEKIVSTKNFPSESKKINLAFRKVA